ncbi:MAG: zinc-ribbon domain-containing protein [Gemmatimonadales bacterium]
MNVTCPSCSTIYRIDPAKVPERGVRARCRVCAAVFRVEHVTEPAHAGVGAEAGTRSSAQPATPFDTWREPVSTTYGPPAEVVESPSPPSIPVPDPGPVPVEKAPVSPPPAWSPHVHPPVPEAAPAPARRPPAVSPPLGMPPVVPPGGARPPAPVSPTPVPPTPPRPAGRRVNPFMTQDPDQKAKRLARALISDLVVYYPERREEGLREGSLKELFDEEIRKSWEEYTDQVGRELAERTNHFRDALNEILAGGARVF